MSYRDAKNEDCTPFTDARKIVDEFGGDLSEERKEALYYAIYEAMSDFASLAASVAVESTGYGP